MFYLEHDNDLHCLTDLINFIKYNWAGETYEEKPWMIEKEWKKTFMWGTDIWVAIEHPINGATYKYPASDILTFKEWSAMPEYDERGPILEVIEKMKKANPIIPLLSSEEKIRLSGLEKNFPNILNLTKQFQGKCSWLRITYIMNEAIDLKEWNYLSNRKLYTKVVDIPLTNKKEYENLKFNVTYAWEDIFK